MKDPVRQAKLNVAIPLGRMARPEEISSLVAFLAGDGGSYLTATTNHRRRQHDAESPAL
jgi:glucose 1-dehydrogenase